MGTLTDSYAKLPAAAREEIDWVLENAEDFPFLSKVFSVASSKSPYQDIPDSSLKSKTDVKIEEAQSENSILDDDPSYQPKIVNKPDVLLKDIGGLREVKQEIKRIIDFTQSPGKYRQKGASLPKGILLHGPPGTGKTTLARAMARESGVPMIEAAGTDFDASYHGLGRARIQKLFQVAQEMIEKQKDEGVKDPSCIIYIDEIDTIAKKRGVQTSSASTHEVVMMELARQMDGFTPSDGIMVMASTNKPEILDPALIRPGRFDEHLDVPAPDKKGRLEILNILIRKRKMPLKKDVDLKELAAGTFGFNGSDLNKLVNKAAIMAGEKENLRKIGMEEFRQAYYYVLKGPRRYLDMRRHEKESTAIHEAGHALVGLILEKEGATPLRHITILPHTGSLGTTYFMPENDEFSHTLRKFKAELALTYAGRIAEEMAYGPDNVSSGAYGDIEAASEMLWKMVAQYGFNESLGQINYDAKNVSMGYLDGAQNRGLDDMPNDIAGQIYEEMRRIAKECQENATKILTDHYDSLIALAQGLMEWEVLGRQDVIDITGIEAGKPEIVSLKDLADSVDQGPPGLTPR